MTISIVTGSCGFIGSHMCELLLEHGHTVRGIDNLSTGKRSNLPDGANLAVADINTIAIDDKIFDGVDYIFHFAGIPSIRPSLENPEPYMLTNAFGTTRMLEAARRIGVKKFVYAASSASYGEADIHPTPETAEIKLQHPYGLSKHLGEMAVMHWGQVFDLPVISMRMWDVFGERADSTVVGIFLRAKKVGNPITIFGDGNQERDFIDCKDVCRAYLMAAESNVTGEAINIGSGKSQTINRLVESLGCEYTYAPKRENEPYYHEADISKAKRLIGWEPQIKFEDTIQRILAYEVA